MFVDPENGDFALQPDSPALALGFKPFDTSLESFGIKKQEFPENLLVLDRSDDICGDYEPELFGVKVQNTSALEGVDEIED